MSAEISADAVADDVDAETPPAEADSGSRRTGASGSAQIAASADSPAPGSEPLLEAIRQLQARLAAGTEPAPASPGRERVGDDGQPLPIPPPPDEPRALRSWIERLHASVLDLAADQLETRRQLSALIDLVEKRSFDQRGSLPPSVAERTLPAGESRLRSVAKTSLRRTLGSLQRLWRAAAPNDWILDRPSPESTADLSLGLVLIHESDRLDAFFQGAEASGDEGERVPREAIHAWVRALPELGECFAWNRQRNTVRLIGGELRQIGIGPAADPDAIRASSRTDVCLSLDLGPSSQLSLGNLRALLPPVARLRSALAVMAIEDLPFLYLFGAEQGRVPAMGDSSHAHGASADLLLCRWSWWHPDSGIDPERIERTESDKVIGKARSLAPAAPGPRYPQGRGADWLGRLGLRPVGAYWLRADSKPYPVEHALRLGLNEVRNGTRGSAAEEAKVATTAIVLGRALEGGLEGVVSALLRRASKQQGRQGAVLSLVAERPGAPHPLSSFRALTPWVFELAELADPLPVGALAARLLLGSGTDRLLYIGEGEGFYDQPEVLELLAEPSMLAFDLRAPRYPPSAPPMALPADVQRLRFEVDAMDPDDRDAGDRDATADTSRIVPALVEGWWDDIPGTLAARRHLAMVGCLAGSTDSPADSSAGGDARPRAESDPVFLVVRIADLVDDEGPDDFVKLAASFENSRAPSLGIDVEFAWVGRGPLAADFDHRVRHLGLRHCHRWADLDPRIALGAADLVCSTARRNWVPGPLAVALRAGKPVIATGEPGLAAWLGAGGRRIVPGDVEGLRTAILGQIAESRTPSRDAAAADAAWRPPIIDPGWAERLFEIGRPTADTGGASDRSEFPSR